MVLHKFTRVCTEKGKHEFKTREVHEKWSLQNLELYTSLIHVFRSFELVFCRFITRDIVYWDPITFFYVVPLFLIALRIS